MTQCSYVDLLRTIQHPAYREGKKKADVFVSLAVNCLFLDVVDTLLSHFFNCLDSIMVWFDVLTINQHTFSEWWSCDRTCGGIRNIGYYTVMVLARTRESVPLNRRLLLFELYCTNKEGCRFEVALGPRERAHFIAAFHENSDEWSDLLNAVSAYLDAAKSDADTERPFLTKAPWC